MEWRCDVYQFRQVDGEQELYVADAGPFRLYVYRGFDRTKWAREKVLANASATATIYRSDAALSRMAFSTVQPDQPITELMESAETFFHTTIDLNIHNLTEDMDKLDEELTVLKTAIHKP